MDGMTADQGRFPAPAPESSSPGSKPTTTPLAQIPLEITELIVQKLKSRELVALMETCVNLRDIAGSDLHTTYFTSDILPSLIHGLINACSLRRDKTAAHKPQKILMAALRARTRYVMAASVVCVGIIYLEPPEPPEPPPCFRIARNQRAVTHVNRAFWSSKMTLLHAAALAGADEVARSLLDAGAETDARAQVGRSHEGFDSFPGLTALEVATAYKRTTTVSMFLKAGAAISRSWEVALDGGEVETVRAILAHDGEMAKRPISSDVGSPTIGTFLHHRRGWELAGRAYESDAPSGVLVSELIGVGADMSLRWNWDDDASDQSLIRAINVGWGEVALVLAAEWSGSSVIDRLLACKWDCRKEELVLRCIEKMSRWGIKPTEHP